MKNIFKHFGLCLSVVLAGMLAACHPEPANQMTDLGLGIKVFFPTKVVAGQPMTINGSGFNKVTAVVFPDNVTVTDFEIVSNDMIKVTAPAGISKDGGNLIVRTSDEQAESRIAMTVGKTVVSGFSKLDGEEAEGGELITIYGEDLEFISAIELLDADGNPFLVTEKEFYRKGTNSVMFYVPRKNIFDGSFIGKVYTYDGLEFAMPELKYSPASNGGHWETKKNVIWTNENGSAVSWSGTYRFALEGHDGNKECIAEFPQDIWDKLKTETFYLDVTATDPQVRVTTGWWDPNWVVGDIQPGNELLTDNGDGTFTVEINISEDQTFVDAIDERHLLFTGDRFTPVEIYFTEEVWVDGGGHWETQKDKFWENDGSLGAVSWSGSYRFALEGHDGNKECCAELSQEIWDRIKTETFYLDVTATDPQVRVTTGWWDPSWVVGDIQPGNERITDNGDGTFTIEINISEDQTFVDAIDERHLLFTGDRFTPIALYFSEEVWIEGGEDDGPKAEIIWKNDDALGAVSWSGSYRFALEGHDGNKECCAELSQEIWDYIKTGTFYLDVTATDPQIRVTTGWWDPSWVVGDIQPGNELLTDNGDGTFTVKINISEDQTFVDAIDERHLLFTGDRFTPISLYYYK